MCGLVGVIANQFNGFNALELDLFRDMLIVDSIRGEDSTGVFSVNRHGNASYAKLATHPYNLVKSKQYDEWRQAAFSAGRALIGHNRKATVGSVSNANAHPFVFGPVMLVHNGSITNFRSLLTLSERNKHHVDVDSHAAAVLLARNEPEKIIPEFRGAYALIWYNINQKRLYFIRNDERPLTFCRHKNNVYFASERMMLEWMIRRKVWLDKGEELIFESLKSNVLLSVGITDQELTWETTVFEAPKIEGDKAPGDKVISLPPPKKVDAEIKHPWRIHYGYDEAVDPEIEDQQIIFSVDDYKPMGNRTDLWLAWGHAHESERIQVACNFHHMDEKSVEKLAVESYLIAKIRRVKVENGITEVSVIGSTVRPVEMLEMGGGFKLEKAHYEHMVATMKCHCGVDLKAMEDNDVRNACFFSKGFYSKPATPDIKYNELEFGQPVCDWCMKAEAEGEASEAGPSPAVQGG